MERGGGFILYSMHSGRRCVFPHKLGALILRILSSCLGFVFFKCFYLNSKLISQKTVILQWVLFLIEFAYSHSGVEILLAGFSCVTSLDTGYITALDMCEVCTEAVHSVEV